MDLVAQNGSESTLHREDEVWRSHAVHETWWVTRCDAAIFFALGMNGARRSQIAGAGKGEKEASSLGAPVAGLERRRGLKGG